VGEEKACCSKDQKCCEKCTDKCTSDKKCCEKCNMGEKKACCSKDATSADKVIDSVSATGANAKKAIGLYACPMHKDITGDMPGKCSKCGMDMVKTK
jgi:hypothetical protein